MRIRLRPSWSNCSRVTAFHSVPLTLFILVSSVVPSAAGDDSSDTKKTEVKIAFGYSFGLASASSDAATANSKIKGNERDNDPLVSIGTTIGVNERVRTDLVLGLANFGRIKEFLEDPGTQSASIVELPDVRRSVIADLSLRSEIFARDDDKKNKYIRFYGTLNMGFLFDAQQDEANERVEDASSYFLAGPSLQTRVGDYSEVMIDFLAGQSEVMTNIEPFSRRWSRETLRMRPRIRFYLDDRDRNETNAKEAAIILGLWADLGFSEHQGDTYVVFISRVFGSFPRSRAKADGGNQQ